MVVWQTSDSQQLRYLVMKVDTIWILFLGVSSSLVASPLLPIGFRSQILRENDLFSAEIVAEFSDSSTKQLTDDKMPDRCPVISFHNEYISYSKIIDVRFPKTQGMPISELWIESLTFNNRFKISSDYDSVSQATWSPIENKIAFIGITLGGKASLVIYDIVRKTWSIVAQDASSWPSWSPDGRYISFYNKNNEVCLADLSHDPVTLTTVSENVGNRWGLWWERNGILYYAIENVGWVKMNPANRELVVIGENGLNGIEVVDQSRMNWSLK